MAAGWRRIGSGPKVVGEAGRIIRQLLWSECLCPPRIFVEILMLNVMVFGGGVFES